MISLSSYRGMGPVGSFLVGAALTLGLLLSGGCGSSAYPPVPEAQRTLEVDYDYILGPGDQITIEVWGNDELSTMVSIRPDGKLTTKLVEDIQASGKTSSQLARDIEEAYSEYVRDPVVSVTVSGFSGLPDQSVRVLGEATSPQKISFKKHMTLLDVLIASGGLTTYADGNNSVLIRTINGEKVSYTVRLQDLLDGDITANVSLMPGDVLIITESWF